GRRPLSGMVRMGVIKPDDIFAALAPFPLNANEFPGIDVVPVVGGIGTRVARARYGSHRAYALIPHLAEQDAAAFVRISFLAMEAKRSVGGLGKLQHRISDFRLQIADFKFKLNFRFRIAL